MCPKCKTGSLSPATLGSSNWRCSVCGYTEYHPSPTVNTSSSRQRMNSAVSGFNSSLNDLNRARRAQNDALNEYLDARKAQRQAKAQNREKGGKGGWLVVVIAAIIFYFLLSGG